MGGGESRGWDVGDQAGGDGLVGGGEEENRRAPPTAAAEAESSRNPMLLYRPLREVVREPTPSGRGRRGGRGLGAW